MLKPQQLCGFNLGQGERYSSYTLAMKGGLFRSLKFTPLGKKRAALLWPFRQLLNGKEFILAPGNKVMLLSEQNGLEHGFSQPKAIRISLS